MRFSVFYCQLSDDKCLLHSIWLSYFCRENVVGYQTKETVEGFNFVIPTFKNVDGSEIDIQDIKLNPATATSWVDNIQVLDEGGATAEYFLYGTKEETGLEADGWINDDGSALATFKIKPGMSVLIDTVGSTTITFAGTVGTEDTIVESVAGFNFVGNSSPVAISIQDIKLGETATSWVDNIQTLDEGGATKSYYLYCTAEESGLDANGWINDDGSALAEEELEAGLGFLVDTASEGVEITIPGVKLNK